MTPMTAVGGSRITTIEAIGATPTGAKIQQAWLDLEVVQCGYCQSGQIMSASALAGQQPAPDGRRHRCGDGGQHLPLRHLSRIRAAIKQAAARRLKGDWPCPRSRRALTDPDLPPSRLSRRVHPARPPAAACC